MFYPSDGSVVFRHRYVVGRPGENSYQRHALHPPGSAPASDEGPMGAMFIKTYIMGPSP